MGTIFSRVKLSGKHVAALLALMLLSAVTAMLEMSRNVQSGNTQNLKSPLVDQAACCACTHSRYFTGGSPSGLRV